MRKNTGIPVIPNPVKTYKLACRVISKLENRYKELVRADRWATKEEKDVVSSGMDRLFEHIWDQVDSLF